MKGKCELHGKVSYLYVKSAGAKLCAGCVKAGLYKPEIEEEFYLSHPKEAPMTPLPLVEAGEIWRHFKGGLYEIIAIAKDSETKETVVCYSRLGVGEQWVRRQKEFLEWLSADHLPRFAFVRRKYAKP